MRLVLIAVLLVATAASADTIPFAQLDGIERIRFQKPRTECYGGNGGEQCFRVQLCSEEIFQAIGDSKVYYALIRRVTENYLSPDEAATYSGTRCMGEPQDQEARVFRRAETGYQLLGELTGGGCLLFLESVHRLNGRELITAQCSYSGTGNIVDWSFYLAENGKLSKVVLDQSYLKNLDIPAGQDLGNQRYEWRDNRLRRYTFSHPRHCQCVAGYSVDLTLSFNTEWEPVLTFLEGSYQPGFTSLSNARNRSGLEYYRKGNYAAAISEFERAQKLDVSNYEAITNLGLAHLRAGNLNRSVRYSMMVFNLADDRQKANAAYNLGKAFEGLGDLEQSLKFYRAANEIAPSVARRRAVERVQISVNGRSL